MKKVIVSAGLVASAAGLSSAFAQSLPAATPKLWNVSATLRGFYDDNYAVARDKTGSFGWEFSPSISGNADLRQTDIGARYTFGMYYYQQRADSGMDALDYTHQADLWLDHSFNQTLKANISDSIVIAQDPELVDGGSVVRNSGNNLANHGNIYLYKDWTRQFSTTTYYNNTLVVYENNDTTNNINGSNPSDAALLNRIEQKVGMDLNWQFQKETTAFIGYSFAWVRYTADKEISSPWYDAAKNKYINYYSSARDYNTHYAYLGVMHEFSPNLSVNGRGGVSITEMYNDPVSTSTSVGPYADISATYTFRPGSYLQGGFTQQINSTDVVAPDSGGHLTQYQETSAVYMDFFHQFYTKLAGSVISQYSFSKYKDGQYNGQGDSDLNIGLNLNYRINRNLAAEVGYNFDELFSNVSDRGNTRNRVYIGLIANY